MSCAEGHVALFVELKCKTALTETDGALYSPPLCCNLLEYTRQEELLTGITSLVPVSTEPFRAYRSEVGAHRGRMVSYLITYNRY